MTFLYALPGAIAEGLIWGLMAIGVYLSYKVLDIADLTVGGSVCTGACVCAVLLARCSRLVVCYRGVFCGALAGVITGLLHTALGIPSILAGILTQLMLYSVNLYILGGRSLVAINPRASKLLVHMSNNLRSIVAMGIFVTATIIALWLFFYTEIGLTLKSTGDNPDMSRAQSVNVKFSQVLGLAISNGIVALAGSMLAQYKGSANINDGRGAIVIGLAAIFIGLSVSLKIKPNFVVSLIGVVGGGIVYYIVYSFVILLGLKTDYLKMLSAIIVAVFLAVPYLKEYFTRQRELHPNDTNARIGGGENA